MHLYGGGLLECCLSLSTPAVTASCLDSKLSPERFTFPISHCPLFAKKGLRGICSRNLEIKCGAKKVHEDGVTYQRGILGSPEPNSQLVLRYL